MLVVGIDLSGPANAAETAVAAFRLQGNTLLLSDTFVEADDRLILDLFQRWTSEDSVVTGIDAPLSYNVGGGDRPGDARLRVAIIRAGLRPGTVMPPTLTRMVYLTIRGIVICRLLQTLEPRIPSIVEVHPSATMALRGAPIKDVLVFRENENARLQLLDWLEDQGLEGVTRVNSPNVHYLTACACALAAWKWFGGQPVWAERAAPPFHPFDFAC